VVSVSDCGDPFAVTAPIMISPVVISSDGSPSCRTNWLSPIVPPAPETL
jgi:hypothetical protein